MWALILTTALQAEGIPCLPTYPVLPCTAPWFKNKAVFGDSGFPWNSSDYTGSREPIARTANAEKAMTDNIPIPVHENYGPEQADEIVAALKKVEEAYLR